LPAAAKPPPSPTLRPSTITYGFSPRSDDPAPKGGGRPAPPPAAPAKAPLASSNALLAALAAPSRLPAPLALDGGRAAAVARPGAAPPDRPGVATSPRDDEATRPDPLGPPSEGSTAEDLPRISASRRPAAMTAAPAFTSAEIHDAPTPVFKSPEPPPARITPPTSPEITPDAWEALERMLPPREPPKPPPVAPRAIAGAKRLLPVAAVALVSFALGFALRGSRMVVVVPPPAPTPVTAAQPAPPPPATATATEPAVLEVPAPPAPAEAAPIAAEPGPAPAPAPGRSVLHITTTPPFAMIQIGPRRVGRAPRDVDVPIGKPVRVVARLRGHLLWSKVVRPAAAETDVGIELRRMRGARAPARKPAAAPSRAAKR
jgi:hypothetical protein